MGKVKRFLQ